MADAVRRAQRWTPEHPCPICSGWDRQPRGKGVRCCGYMGTDGTYAHCSREEYAGGLRPEAGGTYAHRLVGPCRCGVTHAAAPVPVIPIDSRRDRVDAAGRETGRWEYEGGLIVLRLEANGRKEYRQKHRTSDGREAYGRGDAPITIYRAPEVRAADPSQWIWLVEGERCADALVACGLQATTTPGGAMQWAAAVEAAAASLRLRHVVILPDHDQPGRKYADDARETLVHVCASLRVLELPGLGDGEDVADWLARGGDPEDLVKMAEARPDLATTHAYLLAAEAARSLWSRPLPAPEPTGIGCLDRVIVGIRAESVVVLNGPTGRGKTGLTVQVARSLAQRVDVVYVTSELSARQVLARVAAQALHRPWLALYELGPSEAGVVTSSLAGLRLRVVELRAGQSLRETLDRVTEQAGAPPVLVLDYLQHVARRIDADSPRAAVGRLVDELTTWTRDVHSRAWVVSSVGRGAHRPDDEATAEDLVTAAKEAGEIEYDASVVLYLSSETPGPEGGPSPARLYVSKHRFGPAGQKLGLRFHGSVGSFSDDESAALSELERDVYRVIADGERTLEGVRTTLEAGKHRVQAAARALVRAGLIEGPPYRTVGAGL